MAGSNMMGVRLKDSFYLTLFSTLFLSGCGSLAPFPSDDYGALVVPVHAQSPHKTGFTHRYYLTIDGDKNKQVIITPHVSHSYVFFNRLKPGRHYLSYISGIGRRNSHVAARKRYLEGQHMNIDFEIKSGTITVLDFGFNVKSNVRRKKYSPNDSWGFNPIEAKTYTKVVQDLKSDGYLPNWELSNNRVEALSLR